MSRIERLRSALTRGGATQLGIGPMSEACVDAVVEVANERHVPLMLIGSRRQIECAAQGGGYVNGWTTESFAQYVRARDVGGWTLLCRDHGGPWQNYPEVAQKMSARQALESCKASYEVDLASGYDVIHIDPSIPPAGESNAGSVLDMLFELYEFVMQTADRLKRSVLIEVGTEEQNGGLDTPAQMNEFLQVLGDFCRRKRYSMPVFVVAQTGTLVKETRNVGRFASADDPEAVRRVTQLVQIARDHGLWIKEHNGDYLSDRLLALRPSMGVGASNIAPELGVAETRFLLELCKSYGLSAEADAFLALSLGTRKWEKWLVADSKATDHDKAIMAGHYVFGTPEFRDIAARIDAACRGRGKDDLHSALRRHIKAHVIRLAEPLGL